MNILTEYITKVLAGEIDKIEIDEGYAGEGTRYIVYAKQWNPDTGDPATPLQFYVTPAELDAEKARLQAVDHTNDIVSIDALKTDLINL